MCSLPLRGAHAGDLPPHGYVPFAGEPVSPPTCCGRRSPGRPDATRPADRGRAALRDTASALAAAVEDGELPVPGPRGLGGAAGFLLGSVASAVVERAGRPVVLVRAEATREYRTDASGTATTAYRDVVLGLDLADPDDTVLTFAFDAASRRAPGLRVVRGRSPRPVGGHATDVRREPPALLAPWQDKYPGVDGTDEAVVGRPGAHPANASLDARPVAVGRRIRPARGAPHIGPVTYAAPRRSVAPVAVVPVAVVPHT